MKNIHLIPTEKPSRLHYSKVKYSEGISYKLNLNQEPSKCNDGLLSGQRNIYITSDEVIKDVRPHKGKWQLEKGEILNKFPNYLTDLSECKLVILTTDQDLIEEGVQAIDDEFLEWFVKNPSCERVEVEKQMLCDYCGGEHCDNLACRGWEDKPYYEIIIPQEEPKQETLEEAAEKYLQEWRLVNNIHLSNVIHAERCKNDFIAGAKWQAERMYSEDEVESIIQKLMNDVHCGDLCYGDNVIDFKKSPRQWFEQLKKK
jgi:hypothetical protein